MRKTALTATMLLAVSSAATAQDVRPRMLTLQQVVEPVRRAGFDVRMADADARAVAADADAAGALVRPQLGLGGVALDGAEPQLGMPVARQVYGAATLSVPLWSSGNALGARAASENARATRAGVLATASDAVFVATQAYRKVQLADAVIAARRAAVDDQTSHLRLTEQRVAAGKAARYVTLRDRAALATAQQALEDASSERDQAAFDLEALLDRPQEPIAVEPLVQIAFSDTRDDVLARARRERPALRAAEERLAAAQTGIAAARAAFRPTASLLAQSYNGASTPALGASGGQIQLSAAIPIVDGGSRTAAVARAQALFDRATAARDQVRAGVERDVASAWREFEAATRNLATANAVDADAQEQLRLASLRAAAGKAIEVEVLDALATAASARESIARSVARFDLAVAALHHAAGDLAP